MNNKMIGNKDWQQAKHEILNIWAKVESKDLDESGHDYAGIAELITKKYDISLMKALERLEEVLRPFPTQDTQS